MGYPDRTDAKPSPQQRGKQERAEALTGSRSSASQERRAITREDTAAQGIVKLLSSRLLPSASVTVDDHNAVVDDIRAIAAVLNAMGAKFTGL
jgi:hypothetical protein